MLNIVVVEDEYIIRTGLCSLISKLDKGYHIVGSAENGYDGMMLIKHYQPDLAICDIKMGKYDGLEMIQSLREINVQCRFVILSGYSEFQYAKKAIKLGVEDYLLKPVMVDQLEELLREIDLQVNKDKTPADEHYALPSGCSVLIANVIKIIEKNYHKKITLTEVAGELGVTLEYLSALFTKETGTNFMYYLKKYRIQKASELLLNSGKKIYEIAFAVGYDDPQYFCRVFKEVSGLSPKSFLRTNKLQRLERK